jgi:SNF2 family DNA or RNA helicase
MTSIVDVRVDDERGVLVLSGVDYLDIRRALSEVTIEPRRGGNGVAVGAADAPRLIETGERFGLSLRWHADAERFAHNRARALAQHEPLREHIAYLRAGGRTRAMSLLDDVGDFELLDDHQVVNVAALASPECYGLCLFDEQGAGKTVSVVYAWDTLAHRQVADLLVVIAPKSMSPEWARDIDRFCPTLYRIGVVDGSRAVKKRILGQRLDVVVLGFDTVVSLEHELRALVARRRTVLVVDESFTVKNPEALRTGAVRRLREWAERCWVLCGTPAPNAPQDVRAQVDLADLGVAFWNIEVPDDRAAAAPIVRDVLERRAVYLRSLKSRVLPDLPGKHFDVMRLTLAPRQRQLYDALRDGLVGELSGIDEDEFRRRRASFMARRSAMLQVCSHPLAIDNTYRETPIKLAAVRSIVSARVAASEKVVVWSFFTASLSALVKELDEFGVVRYDGTITEIDARREAVRRFQEDDNTRVFVANPAAAGAGLTLTASRCAVYESFSNQAAHYLQSLDRVHRRGQERDVEYVVLLGDETIELAEYERLRRKEREAQDLLGDVVDVPLTREGMLSELLDSSSRVTTA